MDGCMGARIDNKKIHKNILCKYPLFKNSKNVVLVVLFFYHTYQSCGTPLAPKSAVHLEMRGLRTSGNRSKASFIDSIAP